MPAKRTGKSYYSKPSAKAVKRSSSKPKVGYTAGTMYSPAEIKFFDTVFPAAGIPAGPATLIDSTVVAEIVNGTGPSDRIGRRVKIVKVDYSYTITANGVSIGGASDAVRYDMWIDRQCNGAAPAPAELYTAAAVVGTAQMPNLFNEKRFKRLYTKTHQFNTTNVIGGVAANVGLKVEGSFRPNCIIEYDATTGNITDLTSNNIFQCWSSDIGSASITSNFVRVHYVDA